MVGPSIWLWNLPLKIKWSCDVAKRSFLSSFLVIFRFGLWLTKRFIAANGFLKWNISKKTSNIVGNEKFTRNICILNLENESKSIFERVIIRC